MSQLTFDRHGILFRIFSLIPPDNTSHIVKDNMKMIIPHPTAIMGQKIQSGTGGLWPLAPSPEKGIRYPIRKIYNKNNNPTNYCQFLIYVAHQKVYTANPTETFA